jgi:hypothetical protein
MTVFGMFMHTFTSARCESRVMHSCWNHTEGELLLLMIAFCSCCPSCSISSCSFSFSSSPSLTLANMAALFGVSVGFLDSELSRFVSSGRLNCKIDKVLLFSSFLFYLFFVFFSPSDCSYSLSNLEVGGVVETNRPDKKNAQYQAVIKQV